MRTSLARAGLMAPAGGTIIGAPPERRRLSGSCDRGGCNPRGSEGGSVAAPGWAGCGCGSVAVAGAGAGLADVHFTFLSALGPPGEVWGTGSRVEVSSAAATP